MNAEQLAASSDPGAFAVYASSGAYQSTPHIESILDYFRDVAAGKRRRVEVFLLPTLQVGDSEVFCVWWLGRNPDSTVIVISYSDELAADFGRDVRRIFDAHG